MEGKSMKNLPKIALGAWSWGKGTAGGNQVFCNQAVGNTG
jgi:hypothetical protein